MKKILSLVIAFVMALSLVTVPAIAEEHPAVIGNSATFTVFATVTVAPTEAPPEAPTEEPTDGPAPIDPIPAPPTGTASMIGIGLAVIAVGVGIVLFRKKKE